MKARRRDLLRLGIALPLAGLRLSQARAANAPMEEADYRLIPQQPLPDPSKIEVLEFFYYGCRWCNEFEPFLTEWLGHLAPDVVFRRAPALRTQRWITLTRAYFALEQMGELGRLHGKVFRAFHRDNVNLESEGELMKWVTAQGVDPTRFETVFRSARTTSAVDRAHDATGAYRIDSTPSLVVQGRYLTTSAMAGGVAELLPLADQLVEMVRAQSNKQGAAPGAYPLS